LVNNVIFKQVWRSGRRSETQLSPHNLEERVIYWSIVSTWGIWLIGGLYILAPVIGWCLFAIAISRRLGLSKYTRTNDSAVLPPGCKIWLLAMGFMAGGLIMGHFDFNLETSQIIKSFVGWMKGWALIAVFVYVGATMSIRPSIVYRASNQLAAQTLLLVPVFVLAAMLHLPRPLYVSPLQAVGGPGPEFFTVELYGIEPETGGARWRFFSPWAPAAAFVCNIGFVFSIYERNRAWKAIGVLSSVVVCIMSQSRLGLIAVPSVLVLITLLSNLTKSLTYFAGTAICSTIVPFAGSINIFIKDSIDRFQNARASSSRVRATLQRIAIHRWWGEAPIWGHGIVEKGPHLVEYMPIGSHHTWNGLLYVKGAGGLLFLATPLAWSFLEMIAKSQSDRTARCGLGVITLIILYSFGENIEILVYLIWPGLVIVGIATGRRFVSPFHRMFGHEAQKKVRDVRELTDAK
jgi:hypothetical protein